MSELGGTLIWIALGVVVGEGFCKIFFDIPIWKENLCLAIVLLALGALLR